MAPEKTPRPRCSDPEGGGVSQPGHALLAFVLALRRSSVAPTHALTRPPDHRRERPQKRALGERVPHVVLRWVAFAIKSASALFLAARTRRRLSQQGTSDTDIAATTRHRMRADRPADQAQQTNQGAYRFQAGRTTRSSPPTYGTTSVPSPRSSSKVHQPPFTTRHLDRKQPPDPRRLPHPPCRHRPAPMHAGRITDSPDRTEQPRQRSLAGPSSSAHARSQEHRIGDTNRHGPLRNLRSCTTAQLGALSRIWCN
jgi:hypothetical protein